MTVIVEPNALRRIHKTGIELRRSSNWMIFPIPVVSPNYELKIRGEVTDHSTSSGMRNDNALEHSDYHVPSKVQ
ncbi:hypothetical protein BGAL_0294g00160 [Botrytis galanthina]|uniref:Uncharacterized protein n=1 Tax=Botrytis galanthina TaxID=278940 RepID=A0A4S8R109_9HELO|nr:hypothetical protein BGAL_0294g00160 [Botrytis galanthina]